MIERIEHGVEGGSCLGCGDITMIGVGGLWPQCRVTKSLLSNVTTIPSDCPILNHKRDAGDTLLEAFADVTKFIAEEMGKMSFDDVDGDTTIIEDEDE